MKIDLAEIEPACGHERPADLSTTELAVLIRVTVEVLR